MHKLTTTAIVLAAALVTPQAVAAQLSLNGGFETGTFANWAQFPSGPGQQTIVTTNPSQGTFAARILNDVSFSNSLIKQANVGIGTVQPNGQQLTVSFDARGSFPIGGVAFAEFFSELSGGGTSKAEILGGTPLVLNSDPNLWTSFTFVVTTGPDVGGGVTLQLGAVNGAASGTEMFFDNISIQTGVVDPTPGSRWISNLSGDYFNPANWQNGNVPNGVDAIANFTTPIASGTRTVFADTGYTLGTLRFNSPNTYQLVGTQMTLSSTTTALIEVLSGTPKINLETTFATSTDISVASGASLRISDPVTLAPGVTLNKTGDGTLTFQSSITTQGAATLQLNSSPVNFDGTDAQFHTIAGTGLITVNHGSLTVQSLAAQSLSITGTATASLLPDAPTPATLSDLTIAPAATLSLNNNDLILDYTDGSPIAQVIGYVLGAQLLSAADFNGLPTTLAIAEAADLGLTDFNGIAVDDTTVIAKFTYVGDANLDGQVDALDYERIDLAIGNTGALGTAQGDLNYDGNVDALDYEQVDLNIGNGVGSPLGTLEGSRFIPEPSALAPIALLTLLTTRRRSLRAN
jgi:hypothetical protein